MKRKKGCRPSCERFEPFLCLPKNMALNYAGTWYQRERLFSQSGPFFHLYTSPLESDILMEDDADRTAILNMIALVSRKTGIEVLAFALMSNHLHLIVRGTEVEASAFFEKLSKRLSRYLSGKGKGKCLSDFTCGLKAITSLKQFQDEVAYVIRNPFVVRADINLFAYPWCSGYLYFNQLLPVGRGKSAEEISYRERRRITRQADEALPDGFRVEGNLILPESFVNYKLVEALFGNARDFLFCVLKNVEAQVELALAYGESPHMSDDELYKTTMQLCRTMFGKQSPQDLDEQQRKEMAVRLKTRYYASNGQLARFTGLAITTINTLFPLSAKPH